jgi:hypothetical protein
MKNLFMTIAMAALLMSACGHRTSNGSMDEDAASVDSISFEQKDSMAEVTISVDWPTSSQGALADSIRQYICEELAGDVIQEGEPEVKLFNDGKTAVESTGSRIYKALTDMWKEMNAQGTGSDMCMSYYQHIFKTFEGDRYVSYLSKAEGYMGGAHGFALSSGITFSKKDGRRIGYSTKFDREEINYNIVNQTLFRDTDSPELQALIKEGVRSYFQEMTQENVDDEELTNLLSGIEQGDDIPLPNTPPYFTPQGLSFIYQQYEIAPYAAGMINFDVPYEKVRPFLTEEAAALIPQDSQSKR